MKTIKYLPLLIFLLHFTLNTHAQAGSLPSYGVEDPFIRLYPNPIGRQFYLDFGFPAANSFSVSLLDVLGRTVYVFENSEKRSPGKFRELLTEPDDVLPGTYVLHLRAAGFEAKEKVVIVR